MDFRFPEVEGHRPPGLALLNAYVAGILEASGRNAAVNLRLLEVLALSRSPFALFAPEIALPILSYRLRDFLQLRLTSNRSSCQPE